MNPLLEQAAAFIKAGDIEKGKQLLVEVLKQEPRDENAWLWMSRCVQSANQKRECFERVLSINPQNSFAIEGLARLNRTNATIANASARLSGADQPKSGNGTTNRLQPLLLFIVGILLVCGTCVLGGLILNHASPMAVPTETVADNLKAVMENRGYSFTEQTKTNGSIDQIGKSPNGTSILEMITNGPQMEQASIMAGIPSDSQTSIEDNINDMAVFLNTLHPAGIVRVG